MISDDDVVKHLHAQNLTGFLQSRRQLSSILKYVEELKAIDTTGVCPTTSVVAEDAGALRDDAVHPSLSQEQALRNAPEAIDGFFHVPHVLGTRKGEP